MTRAELKDEIKEAIKDCSTYDEMVHQFSIYLTDNFKRRISIYLTDNFKRRKVPIDSMTKKKKQK